jgi:hypothetical protein
MACDEKEKLLLAAAEQGEVQIMIASPAALCHETDKTMTMETIQLAPPKARGANSRSKRRCEIHCWVDGDGQACCIFTHHLFFNRSVNSLTTGNGCPRVSSILLKKTPPSIWVMPKSYYVPFGCAAC